MSSKYFKNAGFLTLALTVSMSACAGREKRDEKRAADEKQAAATQEEQAVALGEKKESVGKSEVSRQEEVIVERKAEVPTIRSETVGADINRMNIEQFIAIGFPEEIARNVVAYRNGHGPFASVEDLKLVPGMDEQLYQAQSGKLAVKTGTTEPKG